MMTPLLFGWFTLVMPRLHFSHYFGVVAAQGDKRVWLQLFSFN